MKGYRAANPLVNERRRSVPTVKIPETEPTLAGLYGLGTSVVG
jgi:hypothetical protein